MNGGDFHCVMCGAASRASCRCHLRSGASKITAEQSAELLRSEYGDDPNAWLWREADRLAALPKPDPWRLHRAAADDELRARMSLPTQGEPSRMAAPEKFTAAQLAELLREYGDLPVAVMVGAGDGRDSGAMFELQPLLTPNEDGTRFVALVVYAEEIGWSI